MLQDGGERGGGGSVALGLAVAVAVMTHMWLVAQVNAEASDQDKPVHVDLNSIVNRSNDSKYRSRVDLEYHWHSYGNINSSRSRSPS